MGKPDRLSGTAELMGMPPETGEAGPPDERLPMPAWLLLGALLLAAGIPAWTSWLEALSRRGMPENLIQVMVAGLLVLAWQQVRPKIPFPYRPSWVGFFLFVSAGLVYLAGAALSIKLAFWGGFLAMVPLAVWALGGLKRFCNGIPAFAFAFFLLPDLPSDLKNVISLPLQLVSTRITVWAAGLFIPITAQGNIFYINGHAYEVTVACSGLHTWIGFLFAGLMGLLFEKFSPRMLVAVLLGAPLLALLTNGARLFITALAAYWGSPDLGIAIHTNLEYVLFPLGLALMWLTGSKFKPKPESASE